MVRGERVLHYFVQNPIAPEPPSLVEWRAELADCLARVQVLEVDQLTAQKDLNGHVEPRKETLRNTYMKPLKRLGKRQLKALEGPDVLAIPHKRKDARTVADAALRMADAFERHPALLANAGVRADHLATMRRKAHELALAERRSASARNRRSLATRDIAAELARAAELVDQLDGIVMAHHGDDEGKMRYWENCRRVPKRLGRPKRRKKRDDGDEGADGQQS